MNMVVFALRANIAIADVNEDFIVAAMRGDLPTVANELNYFICQITTVFPLAKVFLLILC